MKVFVGYDPREDIAYQVCKHSIVSKQPNADVRPLVQKELRDKGWYTRPVDKLASTEFTFTRFLVPELCNFEGWALFMDCDMILTTDIAELFAQADDRYAVMCVQHRFSWIKDEEIGTLDHTWNYLVGVYDDIKRPKLIHYTEGGPWFENYRNCEFHQEWKDELYDMFK